MKEKAEQMDLNRSLGVVESWLAKQEGNKIKLRSFERLLLAKEQLKQKFTNDEINVFSHKNAHSPLKSQQKSTSEKQPKQVQKKIVLFPSIIQNSQQTFQSFREKLKLFK